MIEFFKTGKYKAVISDVSEYELNYAPPRVKQILKNIPSQHLEIARFTEEAMQLSEQYLKEKIVTKKSLADTQHIAVATVEQVDFLSVGISSILLTLIKLDYTILST